MILGVIVSMLIIGVIRYRHPKQANSSVPTPVVIENPEPVPAVSTPSGMVDQVGFNKSTKVSIGDVLVPRTEPEQDFEIDQSKIKNVEQDYRLDQHDTKVDDLQNKINNLPAPIPTPVPVPTPAPDPVPTPDPIPVVIPPVMKCAVTNKYGYANSLSCENTFDTPAYLKSLTFQTDKQTTISNIGMLLTTPRDVGPLTFTVFLTGNFIHSDISDETGNGNSVTPDTQVRVIPAGTTTDLIHWDMTLAKLQSVVIEIDGVDQEFPIQ